jgi:hypothetical protein
VSALGAYQILCKEERILQGSEASLLLLEISFFKSEDLSLFLFFKPLVLLLYLISIVRSKVTHTAKKATQAKPGSKKRSPG